MKLHTASCSFCLFRFRQLHPWNNPAVLYLQGGGSKSLQMDINAQVYNGV